MEVLVLRNHEFPWLRRRAGVGVVRRDSMEA
jgi:hypothetical protein